MIGDSQFVWTAHVHCQFQCGCPKPDSVAAGYCFTEEQRQTFKAVIFDAVYFHVRRQMAREMQEPCPICGQPRVEIEDELSL